MKTKNKTVFFSRIILFIECISIPFLIIVMASFEKLGPNVIFVPWLFLIPIVSSIIGIILSIKMNLENLEEKLSDTGPLGPKPQVFSSSRKQLLLYSIFIFIFGLIGFIFFINLFYSQSF